MYRYIAEAHRFLDTEHRRNRLADVPWRQETQHRVCVAAATHCQARVCLEFHRAAEKALDGREILALSMAK